MDARILQALDRTQKETAHLVLVPSPWLPATPSSKYRYNKADVFVHSSYPSDRTEDRISPQKKTCGPSTVKTFPTPPPLRNDKQSLEERAELVARLTLYRAIRRAPWSPSRRKRIDSDSDFYFGEDGDRAEGDGPEGEGQGGGIEGISIIGSGRNHLTGEYRNEEDEKAFRRINTSIDEQYCDTPVTGHNTDSYAHFDIQFEESFPQDLHRRERSYLSGEQDKEKANEGFQSRENKVENSLETLRIEVPDPWDSRKFYLDRSEESAQRPSGFDSTRQLSGFNSAQRLSGHNSDLLHLEGTKNVDFDLGYDSINSNSNSNNPSEKSNAESARSCQESSPRSAVLSGQQAYYVLRVRVIRRARSVDNRARELDLDQVTGQGHRGVRGGDRGGDRGVDESFPSVEVRGTATTTIAAAAAAAAAVVVVEEQRGVLLVIRGVTKGSLLTALSAQFPTALSLREGELPSSITVSHTPIRSRIRVSDAFDDIREPNSASDNYENSRSFPPRPYTPQPVVVSLTAETLDFSPILDETSELVLSYS
jgi:hypothetical protein